MSRSTILVLSIAFVSIAGAEARPVRAPIGPTTVAPISQPSTVGSGINTTEHNMAGVPNTATPGTIGIGARPSGLPGDSPTAPGFPGKVGRD